jgi:hypothetical protein
MPPELYEKVIACLTVKYDPHWQDVEDQDRYSTLRQCALVCKTWLPSARSRIFPLVHLSSLKTDRLHDLLNLSPELAQYMTKVVVWGPIDFQSCPLGLVDELAPKLTAVTDLAVCSDLDNLDHWITAEIFRRFQNTILPILQAPALTTCLRTVTINEDVNTSWQNATEFPNL